MWSTRTITWKGTRRAVMWMAEGGEDASVEDDDAEDGTALSAVEELSTSSVAEGDEEDVSVQFAAGDFAVMSPAR